MLKVTTAIKLDNLQCSNHSEATIQQNHAQIWHDNLHLGHSARKLI